MDGMTMNTTARAVIEKIGKRPVATGGIRLTVVEADVLLGTIEDLCRKRKRREGFLTPEQREILRVAIDQRARVINSKQRRLSVNREAA